MSAARNLRSERAPTTGITLPDGERGRAPADVRRFDRLLERLTRTDLSDRQRDATMRELHALERAPSLVADAKWRRAAEEETAKLAAGRGEELITAQRPGETNRVVRRQSGLDWLWSKRRLETYQMAAGLKYGDDYRAANDIPIAAGVSAAPGGGGDQMTSLVDRRRSAQRGLARAREALNGHPVMIALCDRVAGEGERLRTIANGDDIEAAKIEAKLGVALDLLAKHYGMLVS